GEGARCREAINLEVVELYEHPSSRGKGKNHQRACINAWLRLLHHGHGFLCWPPGSLVSWKKHELYVPREARLNSRSLFFMNCNPKSNGPTASADQPGHEPN